MAGRSRNLAFSAGLVAALALLFFFDPASSSFYPPCLFRSFLGITCPGCGSLRAFHQLLHGNAGAAWCLNPGVTVIVPLLAIGLALRAAQRQSGRDPMRSPVR
ncbi:MAG: DUF2752 domain-containing protein [Thermoanaerobaculia bacterium]